MCAIVFTTQVNDGPATSGAVVPHAWSSTAEGQLCVPFDAVPHDFMLNQAAYWPEPGRAGMGRCQDSAATALRKHLMRLSEPNECVAAKQMTTDNVGYGFGSVVNSWIKPFAHAVDHGLSFWSPPLGSYRDGKGKAPRGRPARLSDQGRSDGPAAAAAAPRCAGDSTACWFQPL